MIVVGENLRQLMKACEIVVDERKFDNDCISLSLGATVLELAMTDSEITVFYGSSMPEGCLKKRDVGAQGLVLPPGARVLGNSAEKVKIPAGYMGFIQTKSSLARLFVALHCASAHIGGGYAGTITFEIANLSCYTVVIQKGQAIANLYIAKTSTKELTHYEGRYQGAQGPVPSRAEE